MIDINSIAQLYNTSSYSVLKEINPRNNSNDKRYVYIVKYSDGQEFAIKVCRNAFTTHEKVYGWRALCAQYLRLGIYCPQIVDSINGNATETTIIDSEEYIVYAEEVKRYKTYEEIDPQPDFESIKKSIIESIGLVAANCVDPLPFPSVFCIYSTFDSTDTIDENYQNAESFCKTVRVHYPEYSENVDKIWDIFLYKREKFEPIHRILPKASFQSDLNLSNILIDDDLRFAGYIDFNLSGTETVLSYILINEVCGYRLRQEDIDYLTDNDFLRKCDNYLYKNLELIKKNYCLTEFEKENICLCYNTVYPFSCWTINGMLNIAGKKNNPEYIKSILDWTYYQLTRDDIRV